MPYSVFFVEDEIAIREGIRDNVDWKAHGFEFCGEAPDGEIALPLLQTLKPHVLITDIRMPFMDGLQLSQIVRDRLPATKIVILSGHDEFEYAQKAIQLGVFAYLLKPVSAQDLHDVLQKVAAELEQEQSERQALQELREQVEEHRAALRERFLLKLVTGMASPAEAIEKSRTLGIDLLARSYLVTVIRIEPRDRSAAFDPLTYQHVQQLVAGLVDHNPDAFLLRRDVNELVLLLKGSAPENLFEERDLLLDRIRREVEASPCELVVGSGTAQNRLTEICQSFLDAEERLQVATSGREDTLSPAFEVVKLLEMDKSAVRDFLRSGTTEEFETFFETFSRPPGTRPLASPAVRSYILTDIVLATARFVEELGGDVDEIIPELGSLEMVLSGIGTSEQLRERTRSILTAALTFRDNRVIGQYVEVIEQAQAYMNRHYMNPELSLTEVAAQVSLSASHFSTVFSQETGQTFKEYLTEIRIKKAKELLRMTTLKAFEICDRVGYNDPHYFSHVFHKHTSLTPMEFRQQAQAV